MDFLLRLHMVPCTARRVTSDALAERTTSALSSRVIKRQRILHPLKRGDICRVSFLHPFILSLKSRRLTDILRQGLRPILALWLVRQSIGFIPWVIGERNQRRLAQVNICGLLPIYINFNCIMVASILFEITIRSTFVAAHKRGSSSLRAP